MTPRALFALAPLMALSCAPASAPVASQLPELTSSDSEQALLARYPRLARREGLRLLLLDTADGEPFEFVTKPCVDHDGNCIEYRLDAVFAPPDAPVPPIFGVREQYYEGHSYTLVSQQGILETGERPIASPNGRMLAAAASSDSHPPNTGIAVLRLSDGAALLLRLVSPKVLTHFSDLRWVGSGCVSFQAAVVNDGTYGTPEPFALIEAKPEWRLARGAHACSAAD